MRRFAAHLALAAMSLSALASLATAAELSNIHACCLRSGAHHCHSSSSSETSTETEFRSPRTACPYSAPLLSPSFSGLHAAAFHFAAPGESSPLLRDALPTPFTAAVRNRSTRAPPELYPA